MRMPEAAPFLLASLLVAGLVVGAIVERQGRSGPAGRAHEFRTPLLIAYAGGPGEVVLDWRSEPGRVVRWQYRMEGPGSSVWGAWTDIPGSNRATSQFRVSGLEDDSGYRFEVRPVLSDEPSFEAGDPLDRGNWGATTLFVGDDGIAWARAPGWVEGGRPYRIDRSDYVIDVPVGMVLRLGETSLHSDGSFSGPLEDWVSGSALLVQSGEYVSRRVAWTPEGDPWAIGLPNPDRVNEWFDQIVASTRRIPRSGGGPIWSDRPCAPGVVTVDPTSAPSLAVDCGALLIARRRWAGDAVNWDASVPIQQWEGVTIGGSPPRVEGVELPDLGIEGTIDPMFARLSALRRLDLSGNRLTGEISPDLGALKNLEVLNLAENEGLYGCVPRPLRQVPQNDLDNTLLPSCLDTAGLEVEVTAWEVRLVPTPKTIRAPGTLRTDMVAGETQLLRVSVLRAPWAPVTVEFLTDGNQQIEFEPSVVRFEAGVPGQSRSVRLTAQQPGEDMETSIRTTSSEDQEFDDLRDSTLLVTVAPTHLHALVGGDVGEVVLEWSTFEENVERWQYRQKRDGRWGDWTDILGSGSYHVTGLEQWRVYVFEVRPWTAAGPGRPSNSSEVVVAEEFVEGLPSPHPGSAVESGQRYQLGAYTFEVPPDMRLEFGFQAGGTHSRGVGQQLVDLATGSWIMLWSDGRVLARVIRSPEVVGEPGSTASMRHAQDANRRFDQLLDSLRKVPVHPGDDGGH